MEDTDVVTISPYKKALVFDAEQDYDQADPSLIELADVIIVGPRIRKAPIMVIPEQPDDIESLITKIDLWGKDRTIFNNSTSQAQITKLIEEFGEIAEGDLSGDIDIIRNSIGNTAVVLVMIAGIEEYYITMKLHVSQKAAYGDMDKSHLILQCLLLIGKLASGIAKKDLTLIYVSLDELMSALTFLSMRYGISFLECLQTAYDTIKDSKGVVVDGFFIKDTDPKYQDAV